MGVGSGQGSTPVSFRHEQCVCVCVCDCGRVYSLGSYVCDWGEFFLKAGPVCVCGTGVISRAGTWAWGGLPVGSRVVGSAGDRTSR